MKLGIGIGHGIDEHEIGVVLDDAHAADAAFMPSVVRPSSPAEPVKKPKPKAVCPYCEADFSDRREPYRALKMHVKMMLRNGDPFHEGATLPQLEE